MGRERKYPACGAVDRWPCISFCQKLWLLFDAGFVDQKHRDVIPNRIDTVAGAAFELILVLVVGKWSLAGRAGEDFQQVAANHNVVILTRSNALAAEIASLTPKIPSLSPAKTSYLR